MTDSTDAEVSDELERAARLVVAALAPRAVLLYGSRLSTTPPADADTDIAVLLGTPAVDPFALAKLRTDLEAILRTDADLVVLDDASPILAMQVLRKHRMLYREDESAWHEFVARTLTDYFDLKRTRAPIEAALLSSSQT